MASKAKSDSLKTIVKKKVRKGVAKKHPNKSSTTKEYRGQGRF